MNFRRVYEKTHLREEWRRNFMAVDRFLQGNREDYSHKGFCAWLRKLDSGEFFEYDKSIDENRPFYYAAAEAILDNLNADISSYKGLAAGIEAEKKLGVDSYENNYDLASMLASKYSLGASEEGSISSKKDFLPPKDRGYLKPGQKPGEPRVSTPRGTSKKVTISDEFAATTKKKLSNKKEDNEIVKEALKIVADGIMTKNPGVTMAQIESLPNNEVKGEQFIARVEAEIKTLKSKNSPDNIDLDF